MAVPSTVLDTQSPSSAAPFRQVSDEGGELTRAQRALLWELYTQGLVRFVRSGAHTYRVQLTERGARAHAQMEVLGPLWQGLGSDLEEALTNLIEFCGAEAEQALSNSLSHVIRSHAP